MIDFIGYVVSELKSKRLSRENALALVNQFSLRSLSHSPGSAIHPLLHTNTSDFSQQSYRTVFTGEEFFLRDHQVRLTGESAHKVLPGVAYLEMVRAGLEQALSSEAPHTVVELYNTVWAQPLVVSHEKAVSLSLWADESGQIEYEISSDAGEELQVHCQGSARLSPQSDVETVDLKQLQGRLGTVQLERERVYAAFRGMGLEYGRGHQSLEWVRLGEGELLARLNVPSELSGSAAAYGLHPSVLDGALQASIGLWADLEAPPRRPAMPYALEKLRVVSRCAGLMYAWVRYSPGSGRGESVVKLDIDLCDEQGRVCVQMRGFSARALSTEGESKEAVIGTVLSQPRWIEEKSGSDVLKEREYAQRYVLLCEPGEGVLQHLDALKELGECVVLRTPGSLAERYSHYALECFERVQKILHSHPVGEVLVQWVVPQEIEGEVFAGVSGLLWSAELENPHVSAQVIRVPAGMNGRRLCEVLREEARAPARQVRYTGDGRREVLSWESAADAVVESAGPKDAAKSVTEAVATQSTASPLVRLPYKDRGVYLITGGLGGLGQVFAREILEQTPQARVILSGRGALDEGKAQTLKALNGTGSQVSYRPVDLGDRDQVKHLIGEIRREYGELNGIIHSAGMIADSYLVKKTQEEFEQVLEPKVRGTYHLDEGNGSEELDFLVLFSSVAGVLGNVGQGDYAAANGFMDEFASYRNERVKRGERRGRTVSINWPLWSHGGMRVGEEMQASLQEQTGLRGLESEAGVAAFYRALEESPGRSVVLSGEVRKLTEVLAQSTRREQRHGAAEGVGASASTSASVKVVGAPEPASARHPSGVGAAGPNEIPGETLEQQTQEYLRQELSEVLKLSASRLDVKAPLEQYGIDSIMAMKLTQKLEKSFGSLPKTLFFEYRTIRELSEHLVQAYRERVVELLSPAKSPEVSGSDSAAAVLGTQAGTVSGSGPQVSVRAPQGAGGMKGARQKRRRELARQDSASQALTKESQAQEVEPIAIVGLSGRYPQAPDLKSYWENLRDGKDCIEEVPPQRWDWREYYNPQREEGGWHFSKWGGFISGVDEFDPLFFNISPREAELIDPQERLFLQQSWMALEDAGYTRAGLQQPEAGDLGGQVGVYVGVMYSEYPLFAAQASVHGPRMGVSGSFASIANRVSYVLNLHGPSMTVDTMCSSSLTAIHLACQDLRAGRTVAAIAGGVNVSIHPNKYLMLSAGQFISTQGQCQSFGEGGDGYIPGEGVGAVVLKRLTDAQRDGDHIYGLIRGSALSHGGKTHGYTVPNPQAQASAIRRALRESGRTAREVSYIEAHGTGTKLGDPIEIAGLNRVFQECTTERGFCRVGSAKSNIGHCESAAGIAGLTKVLLQLKHGQVVPSLHSSRLNPHIDFDSTAFVVNQSLREWEWEQKEGKRQPRVAGISSFGAGGSNAHLIVEEYLGVEGTGGPEGVSGRDDEVRMPVLIPLSARTAEQLKQKVRDLLEYVSEVREVREGGEKAGLKQLAYTLQVGREGMQERAGFVVSSLEELKEKLQGYVEGKEEQEGVYQGQSTRYREALSLFSDEEDLQPTLQRWREQGKWRKWLELWVKGVELQWDQLYGADKPRRVSLPTYPFARQRYWLPVSGGAEVKTAPAGVIHPLLHTNTSDFSQQSYRTVFTGEEFFLRDHQVRLTGESAHKVLPGVAYLEMVRAGIEQALSSEAPHTVVELYNTVWAQPLVVSHEKAVSLSLWADEAGQIEYEISSDAGEELQVHCQGSARLSPQSDVETVDLKQLQGRLGTVQLERERVYAAFRGMGLEYGRGHQSLEWVRLGEGELLARLSVPSELSGSAAAYGLHPSVLDGALQASIGLWADLEAPPRRPAMPYALEKLRVVSRCAGLMYAWVRYSPGSGRGESVVKLDIDLCDEQGRVCVQMRGFSARALSTEGEFKEAVIGTVLSQPRWIEEEWGSREDQEYVQRYVLLCEPGEGVLQHLDALKELGDCVVLRTPGSLAERYSHYASECFERIQKILHSHPVGEVLIQWVVPQEIEGEVFAGVSGLLWSVGLENPHVSAQVIRIPAGMDGKQLCEVLREEAGAPVRQVRYTGDGRREVLSWESAAESVSTKSAAKPVVEAAGPKDAAKLVTEGVGLEGAAKSVTEAVATQSTASPLVRLPYKDRGVYLITGGLGGLGQVFAREILEQTPQARVILSGRGALDEGKAQVLKGLNGLSSQVSYRPVDLGDRDQVKHLIGEIRREYGELNGIIHSAGMIADSYLVKKTKEEFEQVLEPKVKGTYHLDEGNGSEELDFLVLFSSVAGVLGNIGQGDYAAANGFMDEFASYRNERVKRGERRGRTVSINWPLWSHGGMRVGEEMQASLQEQTGLRSLESEAGVAAFYRALEESPGRSVVLSGEVRKLTEVLAQSTRREQRRGAAEGVGAKTSTSAGAGAGAGASPVIGVSASAVAAARPAGASARALNGLTEISGETLEQQTEEYLRQELSEVLKLSASRLDVKAPLEQYGIDSVMAMKLTQKLEKSFGSLPKTLFFEYQTVAGLAGYFLKAYPQVIQAKLFPRAEVAVTRDQTESNRGVKHPLTVRRKTRPLDSRAQEHQAVAIVGLGGRYPLADDLDEFWENLKNGRDCITEVPTQRWDNELYYDHDRTKVGKSHSKWGGFIRDVDKFDPLFFNISPREAEVIDPQERLFLETVWQTLEDAGCSKTSLAARRVGVFVGVMWGQYQLFGVAPATAGPAPIPTSSYASIANRVSYFFDFHGPSMAVDTMCSSSLTAIHLASEAIRRGEIDAAIAGGVNLSIHPQKYLGLSQGKFVSSDGRCRSFGAGGDGYVPGEGVGAVLLKSLESALRDADQIYAVIRSSSINHGGKTNGYSVPNPNAQGELILDALRKAKVDPRTLSYVETHGTGTSLGDPIEVAGLSKAFEAFTTEKQFCPIGSVKSNIGHLESAAGIAAVSKVLLQIRHGQLVPSLHADPLNPNINFAQTPFYVQKDLTAWQRPSGQPHRVGISSFGAGGSNAHLILEEHLVTRELRTKPPTRSPEVFVLSARDGGGLHRYAEKFLQFLRKRPQRSLADIAFTSQVGRTHLSSRLAILAFDPMELEEKLLLWTTSQSNDGEADGVFEGNMREGRSYAGNLIDGEAGKSFLRELLARADLAKLARLWTLGAEIDWSLLHRESVPVRISLPTYPFVKDRYWVSPAAPSVPAITVTHHESEQKQRVHYVPHWKNTALLASEALTSTAGPILIVDASAEIYEAIHSTTASNRQWSSVVLVKPGESFCEVQPGQFTVHPERPEDFAALAQSLQTRDLLPHLIIHNCDNAVDWGAADPVTSELNHNVYTLFHLSQALMRLKRPVSFKIVSVFSSSSPTPAPQNAALGGFFKTLALENPQYLGKVVEIRAASVQDSTPAAQKLRLALQEAGSADWSAREVRYHFGSSDGAPTLTRQVRELSRHGFPETASADTPLRQEGVYIVTGGLGGLGFLFSEYLARRFRAKLVLLGRSDLSAEREQRLREFEKHKAEVVYVQGDVSNASDVERAVREAKRRFGKINGVVHAAGLNRDSFILKKTREEFEAVLSPKVHGVVNLDRATREESLDLFIMFSSMAGFTGNAGQCDYAYGNHFMDAFAQTRESLRRVNQRAGKTLSISWPYWEAGGMTLSQSALSVLERDTGLCPLPTAEGFSTWEEFLRADVTHGLALYGVASRIELHLSAKSRDPNQEIAAASKDTDVAWLVAKTSEYLRALIGEEIKLAADRIDPRERFESFGIDSIVVGRINSRLERDLGALPKTLVYEYETVEELTKYLVQQHQTSLAGLFHRGHADEVQSTIIPALPTVSAEPAPTSAPNAAVDQRVGPPEPIAIVGIHGCFPGSADLNEYWEHLRKGSDLVDLVPPDRWNHEDWFHPDPDMSAHGKIYCKWGGFLDDHDKFDAAFFNIPPEEARLMDPQERIFLESVWSAIEDAGYTRGSLRKRFPKARSADVGVFVGVTTNTYPGALPWSVANRVSYFFDFAGPSLPIDTACSSSLVAIHLACESLRRQECQVAIAGGVNIYSHPGKYQLLCQRRMLSAEGKCRSYGSGDDGFVPGEGVGTLVLKPLSRALQDADRIHAVIAGSGFDHSGRANGYSAPNPNSQAQLIQGSLAQAGIDPDSISYVEGHGTGTRLGDSLEIAALSRAFQERTSRGQYCAVGSVKANMGHAESAAGIAGVAKVLLQMKHRELVPTLHSEEVNPDIPFEDTPFYLQRGLSAWEPPSAHPRRALVNSFGAGGVNACLILEEFVGPDRSERMPPRDSHVCVLSAKNEERLRDYAKRLLAWLTGEESIDIPSLCYTLQMGREAMQEKMAIVFSDVHALMARLSDFIERRADASIYRSSIDPRREGTKPTAQQQDMGGPAAADMKTDDLARAWVSGREVRWESLYTTERPVPVALPTYPFARERHWITDPEGLNGSELPVDTGRLHPLVSHNSSTLSDVSFSSWLSDEDFYAVDHRINGQRIFPAAGFLEIACICGTIAGEQKISRIRDVVWIRPLSFQKGSQTLRTFLKRIGEGVEYAMTSWSDHNEREVHSEGRLYFKGDGTDAEEAENAVSIQELRDRCTRRQEGAQFYADCHRHGFEYGPAFQVIKELYFGRSQVLAKLVAPEHLRLEFDRFILHPSLIDGALQSISALVGDVEPGIRRLPFALDEVEIIRAVPQSCYACVDWADADKAVQTETGKFNIRLLNERGEVLVKLTNLYVRAVGASQASRPPVSG